MVTLFKNLIDLDGRSLEIKVQNGKILPVDSPVAIQDTVDAGNKIVAPSWINAHTHAGMTLFKGFADDMSFKEGWEGRVWPAEKRMSPQDCYYGMVQAIHEFVASGTSYINDMYFHLPELVKATKTYGFGGHFSLGPIIPKIFPGLEYKKIIQNNLAMIQQCGAANIRGALTPHAPYSVEEENLEWVAEFSRQNDLNVHIHVAENCWEQDQCRRDHGGLSQVEWLDKTGVLDCPIILAHGVWLEESEYEILGSKDNVSIVHCPSSNMKLCSGGSESKTFRYDLALKYGVNVCVGTDGSVSNNGLDMFFELKLAALLAKHQTGNPQCLGAEEALLLGTENAAKALRLKKGSLAPGNDADFMLLDPNHYCLQPRNELTSHLIYGSNGSVVDSLVIGGKYVMKDRKLLVEAQGENGNFNQSSQLLGDTNAT